MYTADCGRTFWIFHEQDGTYMASRYSDNDDLFGAESHSVISADDWHDMVEYWQMEKE